MLRTCCGAATLRVAHAMSRQNSTTHTLTCSTYRQRPMVCSSRARVSAAACSQYLHSGTREPACREQSLGSLAGKHPHNAQASQATTSPNLPTSASMHSSYTTRTVKRCLIAMRGTHRQQNWQNCHTTHRVWQYYATYTRTLR